MTALSEKRELGDLSEYIVSFDGVGLRLRNNDILRDVTFGVSPRTIHCIVGPNGGGKSSVIKCLFGQMPHTGQVRIASDGLMRIGYVPQRFEFDPTLPITVADFMLSTCQAKPVFIGESPSPARAIRDALTRVGMSSQLNAKLGSLSGGQRQRVLFAQALVPAPTVLVLDEPMTGIDEIGRKLILAELSGLSKKGVTVLWVSHDLDDVLKYADCVTCIKESVVFSGEPRRLVTEQGLLGGLSDPASIARPPEEVVD